MRDSNARPLAPEGAGGYPPAGLPCFLASRRYPCPPMKLTGRNRSTFLWLLVAGLLVGGLAWELLERILSAAGLDLRLGVGPVGFDLSVLAVSLVVNPGTLLGALGGILLFRIL